MNQIQGDSVGSDEPVTIYWRPYFHDGVRSASWVRARAIAGGIGAVVVLVLAVGMVIMGIATSFEPGTIAAAVFLAALGGVALWSSTHTLGSVQPRPKNTSGLDPEPAFTVAREALTFPDGDLWPVSETRWRLSFGTLELRHVGSATRRFNLYQLQGPVAEVTAALEAAGVPTG